MEGHKQTDLKSVLAIPVAIILAGVLIAGAIVVTNKRSGPSTQQPAIAQKVETPIPPVVEGDHILGNPKADAVIIEYSDLQCPYCQAFHETMKQAMAEYASKGKVAWVYRHYWAPRKLPNGTPFHPLGGVAAEATECAAELGGSSKFWAFTDNIFASQSTQEDKLTRLPEIAAEIGLDKAAFTTCLESGKYTAEVQREYAEGNKIGVTGTPNAFILSKNGTFVVEGFVDYPELKTIIEAALE